VLPRCRDPKTLTVALFVNSRDGKRKGTHGLGSGFVGGGVDSERPDPPPKTRQIGQTHKEINAKATKVKRDGMIGKGSEARLEMGREQN
jgi:hypothetical protein